MSDNVLKEYGDGYLFYCPGCKTAHAVGASWQFNGDFKKPTFSPSVLVHYPNQPKTFYCCHSFIKDGMIQFLGDCTHDLAGQTVAIGELPEWSKDYGK